MSDTAARPTDPSPPHIWRHIAAAVCSSVVALGLVRFAYAALLPALIREHWFAASEVVYLGAANLAGYLVGALLGRPLSTRVGNIAVLRTAEVFVILSLVACAFPVSVLWYFSWRLLSGMAGGVTVVLLAATILKEVPARHKGIVSGAIFVGVGLGIVATATLIPVLLTYGLRDTWLGLAVVCLLLTLVTWTAWPASATPATAGIPKSAAAGRAQFFGVMYLEFFLMGLAPMPAMVFLVDFVDRGLRFGERAGVVSWMLFGLGAIVGPVIYGWATDRIGGCVSVRLIFFIQAVALAAFSFTRTELVVDAAALVVGSFVSGVVPLILAWLREVIPGDTPRQSQVWSRAAILFAAAQAVGAYGYSAILNTNGGNHRHLFMISGAAIGIALLINLLIPRRR